MVSAFELAKTDVYCFLICIVLLSSCQGAPRFDSKKGWADVMSSWARSPSKHRLVHKSSESLVRAPQLFCTSKIFFLSVMDQRGMKYFLCVWWLRGTAKRTAVLDRPSWGTRRCQTALNFQQITKTHFLLQKEIILMMMRTRCWIVNSGFCEFYISFRLMSSYVVKVLNPCGEIDHLIVHFSFAKNGWAKRRKKREAKRCVKYLNLR